MSMRNHSAISKSSPRSCEGPRSSPITGVSHRSDTTVANGREEPEHLDVVGFDAEFLVRLAECGCDDVRIAGLRAAAGKRDLPWVSAKIGRAEHEEQRHPRCRRVAEEQDRRGTSAVRRRRRHFGHGTRDRTQPVDDRCHAGRPHESAPARDARGRTLASMTGDVSRRRETAPPLRVRAAASCASRIASTREKA